MPTAMSTTNIHDNGHFCAGNHSFDRTEFGLKVKVGATSCGCLFTAPGVSAACFFRERVSPLWGTPLGVIPQTRKEEVNRSSLRSGNFYFTDNRRENSKSYRILPRAY